MICGEIKPTLMLRILQQSHNLKATSPQWNCPWRRKVFHLMLWWKELRCHWWQDMLNLWKCRAGKSWNWNPVKKKKKKQRIVIRPSLSTPVFFFLAGFLQNFCPLFLFWRNPAVKLFCWDNVACRFFQLHRGGCCIWNPKFSNFPPVCIFWKSFTTLDVE